MGLLGLLALRGLRGFCVREQLGGLKACSVFAFVFILLHLCLLWFCLFVLSFVLSAPVVLGLSSCVVFVALWVWLLFLFPFRYMRKKKGRAVLVRPLFDCYSYSNILYVFHSFTSVAFSSAKE